MMNLTGESHWCKTYLIICFNDLLEQFPALCKARGLELHMVILHLQYLFKDTNVKRFTAEALTLSSEISSL